MVEGAIFSCKYSCISTLPVDFHAVSYVSNDLPNFTLPYCKRNLRMQKRPNTPIEQSFLCSAKCI